MINDRNVRYMDKIKILLLLPLLALAGGLTGCATGKPDRSIADQINTEMTQAVEQRSKVALAQSDAVSQALLPPLQIAMPRDGGAGGNKSLDSRFDLVVNNAAASQVFMGIVSGTRYSMLVHPEVTGAISVNLKDVSVFEALDAIRELYGYEYRVEGTRISIQPLTIQTRIFQVNYLTGQRRGTSEVRVTAPSGISSGTSGTSGTTTPTTTTGGGQSSSVTTTSSSDFWAELTTALAAIVGTGNGRQVVVSAQTGVVVVRALPEELRNVAAYLKASRLSAERQVIIEAKILEVQLSDGYQQGINWAAFKTNPNSRLSIGQVGAPPTLTGRLLGTVPPSPPVTNFLVPAPVVASTAAAAAAAAVATVASTAGGVFGLAFQTSSFAALLSFLETQGAVHVLSSPRIATLNNQKAVLKVGEDALFVTGVSGGTLPTPTTLGTAGTPTLQSFFSGISLDVTPRIDADNNIILHVHPAISTVIQQDRAQAGTVGGLPFSFPTPVISTQETDSIVRAQDGQIVAIGGLMSQRQTNGRSQLPGLGDAPGLGALFGQTNRGSEKRELVILLKPTIIHTDSDWAQDIQQSRERMRNLERREKSENSEKSESREQR